MWRRSLCGGRPQHQPGRPHSAGGCRSASVTTALPEPLPPAAAKSGWSPFCPLWQPCAQVGGGRQVHPSSQAWAGGEPPDYGPQGGQGWGKEGAEPQALPASQPGPVTALLQAPWSPGSAGTRSSARTNWTPFSPTSMQGLLQPAHAVSPLLPTTPSSARAAQSRDQACLLRGWTSTGQLWPLTQGPEGWAFLAGGTSVGMGRVWGPSRAKAGTVSPGAGGNSATDLEAGAMTLRETRVQCAHRSVCVA